MCLQTTRRMGTFPLLFLLSWDLKKGEEPLVGEREGEAHSRKRPVCQNVLDGREKATVAGAQRAARASGGTRLASGQRERRVQRENLLDASWAAGGF